MLLFFLLIEKRGKVGTGKRNKGKGGEGDGDRKRVLTGRERTMGVQACIPTNKQSDGGGWVRRDGEAAM